MRVVWVGSLDFLANVFITISKNMRVVKQSNILNIRCPCRPCTDLKHRTSTGMMTTIVCKNMRVCMLSDTIKHLMKQSDTSI